MLDSSARSAVDCATPAVAIEVTYSEFGERGSVDVLGARRDPLTMVVVEVKSELTAIEATLRKLDEKVRIVRQSLGRERFGFRARFVARLLVLPSNDTARRRVARSSDVLGVVFPDRGGRVRTWLRAPAGDLAGILFVANTNPGGVTRAAGGPRRVRTRVGRQPGHDPSTNSATRGRSTPE